MQIRHYSLVIWHSLWFVLLGVIVCSGATYVISSHMKPIYQANTLIRVNESGGASGNTSIFSDQALAVGEALLVTSPDVLQSSAQKLGDITADQLKSVVSAAPLANTEIIQVQAQANDSQRAANIANTVTTVFIQLQVNKKVTQLQSVLNQLSQQMTTTQANINTAQKKLTDLQKANASANDIAAQNTVLSGYQTSYNSLIANYQQTQLEQTQANNMLIETQNAAPPDTPISPHVLLNTEIAGALGMLLMLVCVMLLDWLDNTIKTSDDVSQLANIEALGSIPFSKKVLSLHQPSDKKVEQAFMSINMGFSVFNKDRRAILITSPRSGGGVSTVASQLALSLAQSGLRVLLVDANLQRPSLHDRFQHPNTKGLSNTLQDAYVLQNYVLQNQAGLILSWIGQWTTSFSNLWLLPAGPEVALPTAQILRSQELQILVKLLLQQPYVFAGKANTSVLDMIIFDAPALNEGIDTLALAPLADGAVLVIEAGKERSETLEKANLLLQRLGVSVLGVVVNRQKSRHLSYLYSKSFQTGVLKKNIANAEAKYNPLKRISLTSETPPETQLTFSTSAQSLDLLSQFSRNNIAKQFLPRTPQSSDLNIPSQSNNLGSGLYDDQSGWHNEF